MATNDSSNETDSLMDVLSALRAVRLAPGVVLDVAGDADGLGEGRIRPRPSGRESAAGSTPWLMACAGRLGCAYMKAFQHIRLGLSKGGLQYVIRMHLTVLALKAQRANKQLELEI